LLAFYYQYSAIDCLGRFVSEMTYYVSSGTLNLTKPKLKPLNLRNSQCKVAFKLTGYSADFFYPVPVPGLARYFTYLLDSTSSKKTRRGPVSNSVKQP